MKLSKHYLRGKEHRDALESQLEDSTLWLHCVQQHNSTKTEFEINLVKRHLTAFRRHVHEGVLIMMSKSEHHLNRKNEFNGSNMLRILIETNGIIRDDKKKKQKKKWPASSKKIR